jgi:hypothetical protein
MAATSTIAALTLVLAANLTDAAVFPTDDANGNTRKATIAQMRTQLNTGPQIFTSTISVSGTSTLATVTAAGDLTVNGATARLYLQPSTTTNGAFGTYINTGGSGFVGLENSTGNALFTSGGVAYAMSILAPVGKPILFGPNGGASVVGTITSGGIFLWGTTVTTGAGVGDVVLANTKAIRSVNTAGSSTVAMLSMDVTSDRVLLSCNTTSLGIVAGLFATTVGVAGPASALPATPVKYWVVRDNDTSATYKIPLYTN